MLPTGPGTACLPVPWRDSVHLEPAAGAPFLPPSLPRLQQGFKNVPDRSALALAVPWGAGEGEFSPVTRWADGSPKLPWESRTPTDAALSP